MFNYIIVNADAVMFNLSPSNVLKYAEDLAKFTNNVSKMARLMAPSILFIDGAHLPFIKKVHL